MSSFSIKIFLIEEIGYLICNFKRGEVLYKGSNKLKGLKIRYLSIIISIVIILSVVIFSVLNYMDMQKEGQTIWKLLIEQKALAKTITRDVDTIYLIMNVLNSEEALIDKISLENKLQEIKERLKEYIEIYDIKIREIQSGTIEYDSMKGKIWDKNLIILDPYIEDNIKIWEELKKDYVKIYENNLNFNEFIKSYTYINENSYQLIEASSILSDKYFESNNKIYSDFNTIIAIVVGSIGIMIIIGISQVYKYLFLPLGELYSGFKEIGFENIMEKKSNGMKGIASEIKGIFQGLFKTLELTTEINTTVDFDDFLQRIYDSFIDYIPYSYIGIALFNSEEKSKNKGYIIGSYGVGRNETINKEMTDILGYEVSICKTSLGDIIETGQPRIINNLERHIKGKPLTGYNKILLRAGIKSSITLPLMVSESCIGFIFFSSDKKNVYKEEHTRFLRVLSSSISIAFQKNIYIEDLLYSTLLALTKISEEKDKDTGEHIVRMRDYSTKLARLMSKDERFKASIDSKFIADIEKFSPMHDIGKVGVPDKILLKPGKLDEDEFNVMKNHTVYGASVLREAENNIVKNGKSVFKMGIEIAESHHEKWDGTGYPKGLKGEEIPLAGRIVALADVLDALLSKRSYKDAFSFEKAKEIILAGRGSHFDPNIVDIFNENIEEFQLIYKRSLEREKEYVL